LQLLAFLDVGADGSWLVYLLLDVGVDSGSGCKRGPFYTEFSLFDLPTIG